MTERVHKVGDIYEAASYDDYPPQEFFDRAAAYDGVIFGPMKNRRVTVDAHGYRTYVAEAEVIQVLPHAEIVGDADDFEGTPVL